MPDTDDEEKGREPDGITWTVKEWIELMNKHDCLSQYEMERREKSDNE